MSKQQLFADISSPNPLHIPAERKLPTSSPYICIADWNSFAAVSIISIVQYQGPPVGIYIGIVDTVFLTMTFVVPLLSVATKFHRKNDAELSTTQLTLDAVLTAQP